MGIRNAISALRGQLPPNLTVEYTTPATSVLGLSAEDLWRTQPELRTVVTFLARNIAQLGVHSFQRVSDTDRQRLIDDPIALLLKRPNDHMTTYELIFSLVADLALYDEAFWFMGQDPEAPSGWYLEPLSPSWVVRRGGDSAFTIDWVEFKRPNGVDAIQIPIANLLWFKGWNPGSPRHASSPVDSLKQLLAEQIHSKTYRQQMWQKGGRIGGVLSRPAGAKWDSKTREKFQRQWQAKYSGNDGPLAGGTPILEDGMTYERVGFSAHEDEYIEGAKLSFATVASVYHVNPTMVGLLDNANFSNVREFRKMLYGDTLGSTISMIEDRINTFLVPIITSTSDVYVEFNIAEKLQGNFEEQAAALSSSVGRPWMTADEARALNNMPSLGGDAERLVTPLNVLVGGQASPRDSAPKNALVQVKSSPRFLKADPVPDSYQDKAKDLFKEFFKRQKKVVLSKLGAKAGDDWWDEKRWNSELSDDIYALAVFTTKTIGENQAKGLGFDANDYDSDRTFNFLRAIADSRAGAVNSTTKARIEKALDSDDYEPADVFDEAEEVRSGSAGLALMTGLAGFALVEAATQLVGSTAQKTWNVQSPNPRPEHALIDGETVGIDETFSNGANWPGDPVLGAEGVANCTCGVTISF